MPTVRQLTVGQMARRVQRYVPELELSFIIERLHAYRRYGLSEAQVHGWVRFFDRFVIDERNGDIDDGSFKG